MKVKILLTFCGIIAALLLMAGCQISTDQANVTNAKMPYVVQLMKASGKHNITLDLSDPKQYEFVLSRMDMAGKTTVNAAEEFSALEKLKAEQVTKKASRIDLPVPLPPPFLAQDHMISKIFSNPASSTKAGTYTVEATSTVKDGSFYSYVDLIIYDENWNQISPYAYAEEYNKGQLVTATLNRPFPSANKLIQVNAVSYEKTVVNGITTVKATYEPGLVGPGAGVVEPMFAIYEPTDKDNNGIVDVCIDRILNLPNRKCDFPPLPTTECYRHAKVPFKGLLRVPYVVKAANLVPEETYIKLISADMGGSVRMSYKGDDGQGFPNAPLQFVTGAQSTTIVKWDIPREDSWFANGDLVNEKWAIRGRLVHWYIKLTFKVPPIATGLPERILSFLCSSDPIPTQYDPTPDITTPIAPPPGITYCPLVFWWSCLAEGTLVRMADGELIPVEKVREGDMVRGPGCRPLSVIGTAVGKEAKPMVRVVDEFVHDLLLTQNHPVKTLNRGTVKAITLKRGDILDTEQGPAKIMLVSREQFEGKVYNLFLGTQYELNSLNGKQAYFYADGIMVGDAALQSCPSCYNDNKDDKDE